MKTQPEPNPPGENVPPLLAGFLLERRDAITKLWIEAVRRNKTLEAAKQVDDVELADHLPKLFDDLSATLRGESVEREAKSDAEAHGEHRWWQHYELEEVLAELGIVSRVLLSHGLDAFVDAYPDTPPEQRRGARERILRFFEDAAAGSVRQYVERNNRQTMADAQRERTVLESITDRFFAFDAGLRYTYLNEAAKRGMAGHIADPAALIGQHFFDVFPEARGTAIEEGYQQAMSEGVMVEFEVFYEPWSRWYESRCYPIQGGGLSVYFRDVTEEKQVAQALAASETKYRSLFDSIDAGFCVLEMLWDGRGNAVDYRYLEVNPAFEQQTGLREVVGKAVSGVIPGLEPSLFETLGHVSRTGEPKRFIEGAKAIDRWFDVYGFAVGTDEPRKVALLFNDITERRRAEDGLQTAKAALHEVAEQRRLALDSAQMGWWHIDLTTNQVHMDERFKKLFDVHQETDFYGKVLTRVHPDYRAAVDAGVKAATRVHDPVPYALEYPVVHEDGSVLWLVARGQGSFDGEGDNRKAVAMFGTMTDITEAKAVQDALCESEERHRLVIEGAQLGTFMWELPSRRVHWNTRRKELFFLPSDTEMTFDAGIAHLHPEDREPTRRAVEAAITNRASYQIEYRAVSPTGEIRWMYATGYPIVDPAIGEVSRVQGVAVDITTQKDAQVHLRELADAMPQIVWSARPDGILDYTNRRWYEYTGQTEGEVSPADWGARVHPDDIAHAAEVWTRSVTTGAPYATEFRVRRADGEYRWFLVRALPIHDAAGHVARWYGTCTDVHDQRALSEQNVRLLASERVARSEAERTSQMKDEFLATLSHELRTPLNAILGWTQVLRGDPANTEDMEAGLATIERNSRAQTQIIEDLLDMSKIISGKVRLDVQPLQLDQVVAASVETMRPAAVAKGIRLQVLIDPEARMISGDPNRLQQVFWNLLSNAIKFTPKEGKVQVVLQRVHSHLEVSIADTGEGIAPEFLPYVFDRFRQQDATTTRRHGGLGLGLAIVKQLVELHGGSIHVDSTGPGQGTTFKVMLPLSVMLPAPAPDDSERRHPQSGGVTLPIPADRLNLVGIKVLVVDDEADARALVQRLLKDRGAMVEVAASTAQALELMQSQRFDVLVSDIGMPEADGFELIRRVRALPAEQGGNTSAMALTAYARSEDRLKVILAGFQMHMAKPVEAAELLALVASLAGRVAGIEDVPA